MMCKCVQVLLASHQAVEYLLSLHSGQNKIIVYKLKADTQEIVRKLKISVIGQRLMSMCCVRLRDNAIVALVTEAWLHGSLKNGLQTDVCP